jgi:hypothetical protein
MTTIETTDPARFASGVEVRPETGWIGAEIRGVDLTAPLDDAQVVDIRAAATWTRSTTTVACSGSPSSATSPSASTGRRRSRSKASRSTPSNGERPRRPGRPGAARPSGVRCGPGSHVVKVPRRPGPVPPPGAP